MDSRQQANSTLLGATLGTAVAVVGYYYYWHYKKLSLQRRQSLRPKIPQALRDSPYGIQLEVAVALAAQAGHNMESYMDTVGTAAQKDLKLDVKTSAADFCTHVDVENERLVTDGLRQAFPKDCIIGEEDVGTGQIPTLTAQPTWIIDPIDGTTNFAAGLPDACVSIGYCVNRRPVLGVVYVPAMNDWYLAVHDHGAFRNGVCITGPIQRCQRVSEAIVCMELGYPRSPEAVTSMLTVVQRILSVGQCRATRSLGSGVLDLCHVATGRLDAVYAGIAGEGWKPWDYCAGVVVVQEAGGVIETITPPKDDSTPFDLYAGNHICTVSPELLQDLRRIILDQKSDA